MLPADLISALDKLAATPRLLIVSDFDGTLSPIVNNPADARALPAASAAVATLSALADTSVALVSGRALNVLRELAALSQIPATVQLIGSHGAEFDSGFAHYIDEAELARITNSLNRIAARHPGVAVETKPASVALHVRNASAADGDAALAAARKAAASWNAHATAGKAVLEFAVIDTDKGEAVDILRRQTDATAVLFLGDDVTDEKAFLRMVDGDLGVKVGGGMTLAGLRVESPEDVADALAYLARRRCA